VVRTVDGVLVVLTYIAALALFALLPLAHAATLASSPQGVAHGHLLQLLSSGLLVDGPVLPQIAALAVVLLYATRRLGPRLTWGAAITAHVGATLLAYALVSLFWLADTGLVSSIMSAPDYGISVVLLAVCGALARRLKPAAVTAILAILAAVWLLWWWLAGSFTPSVLANLEHLLGFAIGAACGALGAAAGGRSSGAPASLGPQTDATSNGGVP
jgi:hypothetical protein